MEAERYAVVNPPVLVVLLDGSNTYVYGLDLISVTDSGEGKKFVTETVPDAGKKFVDFVGSRYYDLNFTAGCGLVETAGVQFSWNEAIHPYVGGGVANFCGGSGSFTVGPFQSISQGLACGAQAGYNFPLGTTGLFQIGAGPLIQVGYGGISIDGKEGAFVATPFHRIRNRGKPCVGNTRHSSRRFRDVFLCLLGAACGFGT